MNNNENDEQAKHSTENIQLAPKQKPIEVGKLQKTKMGKVEVNPPPEKTVTDIDNPPSKEIQVEVNPTPKETKVTFENNTDSIDEQLK